MLIVLLIYRLGSIDAHLKITQAWSRDFYSLSREEHSRERVGTQSSHPGLPGHTQFPEKAVPQRGHPHAHALELKGTQHLLLPGPHKEVSRKKSPFRPQEPPPLPGLARPSPWIKTGSSCSSEALLCFRACFILTFYLWPGTQASHVRQRH